MQYTLKPGTRGLIFDLDGTLVDSMPLHFEAWKSACERFGATMTPAFLKDHAGIPGWDIAEIVIRQAGLTGKVTSDMILNAKQEEFDKHRHSLKPVEPVAAIVKKYSGILPMAIGTGGHRKTVDETLETIGFSNFFDAIVTANDVKLFKPHPETFLRCAELMKVPPEKTLVFEDSDLGLEAARKAGMTGVDVRGWYPAVW